MHRIPRPRYRSARARLRGESTPDQKARAGYAQVRAMLETTTVGVAFFDRNMRVLAANHRYAEMAVSDYETIAGKSIYEINPANEVRRPLHNRVLAGETISLRDVAFRHPVTGQAGYRNITYSPVRDDRGNVVGLLSTVVDVTDRVEAEQRVEEERTRLQAMLDSSTVGFAFYDPDMRIVDANARYLEITGLDLQSARGQSAYLVIPSSSERRSVHERALAGEIITVSAILGGDTPGRSAIYADITYSPVRDAAGNVVGVLGAIVDVTQRVEAEEALRRTEERFRTAVVDSPFPIMIHAEGGQVLEISRGWSEISGYSRSEIPTIAEWTRRAYGPDAEKQRRYIAEMYEMNEAGERRTDGEFAVRTARGTERIWDFVSMPLGRLPDGRRIAMSMAADVTERHELDRRKDEFIAIASHELRTPLTVITGFSHLALRLLGARPAVRRKRQEYAPPVLPAHEITGISLSAETQGKLVNWLSGIGDSAERINRLVEELLAVSRIAEHTLGEKMEPTRFDLAWLCADVLAAMRLQHPLVRFTLQSPQGPLLVMGDRRHIERVVTNLVDNAAKYGTRYALMPGEEAERVEVSAQREARYAVVTVRDWGPGIPEEIQPRIFERFYRGPEAGTRSRSGMGLGLHIAREIVVEHGGEITFTSVKGAGTTFSFKIALAPEDLSEQRKERETA